MTRASLLDELEQILGDVDHLEVHPELRVLVLEGVVAVGRGDQDLLHAVVDEGLDVLSGQLLEERLVAGLADALAAAALLGAQDAESTPALLRILAVAWATFLTRGS